jgi:hypothetical protein
MPSKTNAAPTLPTEEAIELAEYKLGSFTSDLDAIRGQLERCSRSGSVEEFLRLREQGVEEDVEGGEYDRGELARLVVFASDVLGDVEAIRRDAEAIRREALALFHEQAGPGRDPDGWSRYQARIARWHRERLAMADEGSRAES